MTASLPKLSTRLRPPTRYQLRRLEQEVSRFLHGRRASLLLVRHWAEGLSTRLHTRWILLRAATWGPRQRLTTAVHALRKSFNSGLGPERPQARPKPHQMAAHSHRPSYAPRATSAPSRRDRLESVILWVCFILIGACGVLLFAAGREVRQMRFDIIESRAQIAVLKDHIARLEKQAQAERSSS